MPLKNIPKSPFQFGSSNVGAGMDAYEIMSIINMFGDKQGAEAGGKAGSNPQHPKTGLGSNNVGNQNIG